VTETLDAAMDQKSLRTLQPADWPAPKGYAHGMMGSGTFVVLAGQIGWSPEGVFADGFSPQVAQALRNILIILSDAGATPNHIARMTWYVTDMQAYRESAKELGKVWRELMGRHYPAMAVVGVTELVEREALVEIEVTAIL
jgi:enamine deaminase RidA (YjgF/YER057c/UK114 family)